MAIHSEASDTVTVERLRAIEEFTTSGALVPVAGQAWLRFGGHGLPAILDDDVRYALDATTTTHAAASGAWACWGVRRVKRVNASGDDRAAHLQASVQQRDGVALCLSVDGAVEGVGRGIFWLVASG